MASVELDDSRRAVHPSPRPDRAGRRRDVPRLGRAGLDVPLARAVRARLSRLRASREPRAARRGVRGRRALLPRRARRRGRGRSAGRVGGGAAGAPLQLCDRPAPRDRSHGVRPRRDRPLPPRLERPAGRHQAAAARTASFGRCSPSGARRRRRTAAPSGCRSRTRLVESGTTARPDPRRARSAARAARRRARARTCSRWPRRQASRASRGRSSGRCSNSLSIARTARRRPISATVSAPYASTTELTLERGPVRFGPWTIESTTPGSRCARGSPAIASPAAAARCRTCSRTRRYLAAAARDVAARRS